MAWQDRLREAAYTSPSGVRLTYSYEDVARSATKKTTPFEFPDAVGTFVQDLGRTGRRYPLRMFFNGADHDLDATRFEDAVSEQGVGTLEHPAYGVVKVVTTGEINRRDNLKTGANQTIIDVIFFDTIDLVFPAVSESGADAVIAGVTAFNEDVGAQFEKEIAIDTAIEKVSFRDRIEASTRLVNTALKPVYQTGANLQRSAEAVVSSINSSLDALAGDPLTFAAQMNTLMQLPSTAATSIRERLDAYNALAQTVFGQAPQQPSNDQQPNNTFHTSELVGASAFTGAALSVLNGDFNTRADAVEAADGLLATLDDYTNWAESNYVSLGEIDTGEVYQSVYDVVLTTAAYLVEQSFSLPTQKTIVLDHATTIVNLCAELYQTIDDDQVDFLINTNNFIGEELLEVPAGRQVVYFV